MHIPEIFQEKPKYYFVLFVVCAKYRCVFLNYYTNYWFVILTGSMCNKVRMNELRRTILKGKAVSTRRQQALSDYLFMTVSPGHWSVLNGEAGRPAPLMRLQTGLWAQA